jgi:hypothetical protein
MRALPPSTEPTSSLPPPRSFRFHQTKPPLAEISRMQDLPQCGMDPRSNLISWPRIWTGASPPNSLLPLPDLSNHLLVAVTTTRGISKMQPRTSRSGPATTMRDAYLLTGPCRKQSNERNLTRVAEPTAEELLLLLPFSPAFPKLAALLAGMKPRWARHQRNLLQQRKRS